MAKAFNTLHVSFTAEFFFYPPKMNKLLEDASRVEAAVEAYISVREFSDEEQWKRGFEQELVSAHLRGISIAHIFDIEEHVSGLSACHKRRWRFPPPAPHFSRPLYSARPE